MSKDGMEWNREKESHGNERLSNDVVQGKQKMSTYIYTYMAHATKYQSYSVTATVT
jgi:hypothetical protein